MNDTVAIALITSLSALTVAGVTAYFQYKGNRELFELKDKVEHQLERIKALEGEREQNKSLIDSLKGYINCLLEWLKGKGIVGYPEPDKGLLDTDPNIRPVKK